MNVPRPAPKDIETLHNWHDMKGCIAGRETEYLKSGINELLNIGYVKDQSMSKVAQVIERVFISGESNDNEATIIVVDNPFIRTVARATVAALAVSLLLVPIIILNAIEATVYRFVTIFMSSAIFVVFITMASAASMPEIFAAGAAYAAVMVVFVSGDRLQSNQGGQGTA
ncbi:hypothetical protein FQN54_007354 [Arachnomyces sp. PD_36]|nr:hypothetical protein FQN54_007354 [Arachnomyces sp. PD_36]